jgi:hypothetical protein
MFNKSLSPYLRLVYSIGGLCYMSGALLLGYAMFPLACNFGMEIIYAEQTWYLRHLLIMWVIGTLCTSCLMKDLVSKCASTLRHFDAPRSPLYILNMSIRGAETSVWMSVFLLSAIWRSALPSWVSGKLQFAVTGSIQTGFSEDLVCVIPHLIYVALASSSLVYAALIRFNLDMCMDIGAFVTLGLFQLFMIQTMMIPIWFALNPRIVDREKFVERDKKTGIPRIKHAEILPPTYRDIPWGQTIIPCLVTLWLMYCVYITTSKDTSAVSAMNINCNVLVNFNGTEYLVSLSDAAKYGGF